VKTYSKSSQRQSPWAATLGAVAVFQHGDSFFSSASSFLQLLLCSTSIFLPSLSSCSAASAASDSTDLHSRCLLSLEQWLILPLIEFWINISVVTLTSAVILTSISLFSKFKRLRLTSVIVFTNQKHLPLYRLYNIDHPIFSIGTLP